MVSSFTLSSSARLAFIGLSYIYIVKFIDTLWHGVFANPAVFFGIAGWTGMLGSLINILPKMLALSVLLQFYFSFNLLEESQLIAVLSRWLGSVVLLCCCLLFSLLTVKTWGNKTRAFLLGAMGYMILAVTFSMLVVNFFSGSQVNWQDGEISTSIKYFTISASLSFFCIAYFYAGFFGDNGDIGNESR